MALVVESTSSNSGSGAASIAVTAPTGITTGDLLLYIASGYDTITLPSGFTSIASWNDGTGVARGSTYHAIGYKIAVLADESAGSYTCTYATSDGGGAAAMLRVSGWTAGNPLYSSSTTGSSFGTSGEPSSLGASSLSLIRPGGQLMIIVNGFGTDNNTATFSTSSYSITSSDSNPTWTELIDVSYTANGDVDTAAKGFSVAYAVTTDTSTVTAYSFNITESSSTGVAYAHGFFMFVEPTNATGTHSLLEPTTTLFGESAVEVGGVGSNTLFEPSTTFFEETSITTSPTQWTEEDAPTTTWTNQDI